MMMKKAFYFLISALLISTLACDETSDPAPVAIVDGEINGAVDLYDEGTTSLNNEGMMVSIELSNPLKTAITDINGEFSMEDVLFGKYTLVYSKDGFGTYKFFGLEHQNTGWSTMVPFTPSLGKKSSTSVTDLAYTIDGNSIVLTVTTDPGANGDNPRYIRLFYHDQFVVSSTNYDKASDIVEINANPFVMIITNTNLNKLGYASGTTVFLRVYGDSYFSNEYKDPELGRYVFPNANPVSAPAVSFVVP